MSRLVRIDLRDHYESAPDIYFRNGGCVVTDISEVAEIIYRHQSQFCIDIFDVVSGERLAGPIKPT